MLVFSMVRNRRRSIPCLVVARASPPLAAPPLLTPTGAVIFFFIFFTLRERGVPGSFVLFRLGIPDEPHQLFLPLALSFSPLVRRWLCLHGLAVPRCRFNCARYIPGTSRRYMHAREVCCLSLAISTTAIATHALSRFFVLIIVETPHLSSGCIGHVRSHHRIVPAD